MKQTERNIFGRQNIIVRQRNRRSLILVLTWKLSGGTTLVKYSNLNRNID